MGHVQFIVTRVMVVCLCVTRVKPSEFSADSVVAITIGVLARHSSPCVNLLCPSHLHGEYCDVTSPFKASCVLLGTVRVFGV